MLRPVRGARTPERGGEVDGVDSAHGAAAGRRHHGLPLGLGDDAARRRRRSSDSACRTRRASSRPTARPTCCSSTPPAPQARGLRGDHRRRRRRGAPARACAPPRPRCRCSACRSSRRRCKGMDSLLSIVQMPAGVPVGTLAIGRAGAVNAALLAAAIARAAATTRRRRDALDALPRARRPSGARPARSRARPERRQCTIGILGGGQLGRMLALAGCAARPALPRSSTRAPTRRPAQVVADRRRLRRPGRARRARADGSTSSPTSSRTCRSDRARWLARARAVLPPPARARASPRTGSRRRRCSASSASPRPRSPRSTTRAELDARVDAIGLPGGPEDAAPRLRRQGPARAAQPPSRRRARAWARGRRARR